MASNQRFVHDDEVQVWRQDADSSPASKWWSGKVFVDEKGKDPCTLWKGIRVKYRDGSKISLFATMLMFHFEVLDSSLWPKPSAGTSMHAVGDSMYANIGSVIQL